MRVFDAFAQAIREARKGLIEIDMVWIEAINRSTGEVEGIGLWQGEDDESITVTDLFTGISQARTFYSRGILNVDRPSYTAGLEIFPMSLSLSSINDAVIQAFRAYRARGARVQAWSRSYDPDDYSPVGIEPIFAGYINTAPIERPAPGGEGLVEVEVVNTTRVLTITSARRKSHEAQKKRSGDMIRKYKAIEGQVEVLWGPPPE